MSFKKLSILIPVYNEEDSVLEILDAVDQVELVNGITKELIIVNDCSTDHTSDRVRTYMEEHPNLDIHFFEHEKNMGKGAALHTAIDKASGEYCVVQDADLEYDPEEYNKLIFPVLKTGADVVYGSRFIGQNPHRILFFWHTLGNKFLTFLCNAFYIRH